MITINVVGSGSETDGQAEIAIIDENVIDFTLVSSETIGWLNNYATEVAYGRALLAPRPKPVDPNVCPQCGNQPGGCPSCELQLKNYCDSRGITFQQWNANCYRPGVKYGFGNGTIAAASVRFSREFIGRQQRLFDRAYYPSEYSGEYGNQQFYYGYGNQSSDPYTPQQQQYMGTNY
jgi:hypothetical protein